MIEWWGPIIDEYYAGSENIGSTWITSEEWLAHKGSVGRSAQTAIHICDDDGHELPIGEDGLVYFEVAPGSEFAYHDDPAKTASVWHPAQPWRTLGDIGHVDDGSVPVPFRPRHLHDHLWGCERLPAGDRERAGGTPRRGRRGGRGDTG